MTNSTPRTLSPDQVKAKLEAQGITITAWANAHNHPPGMVISVLNGFLKGTRGKARRIAIDLGLRERHPERDAA